MSEADRLLELLVDRLADRLADRFEQRLAERENRKAGLPATNGRDSLLSVTEAAQRLGIHRTMLYKLMQSGELEKVKIGARVFIRASTVNEYIDRLT